MPLYIQRGRGSRKWDVDGNEYIDFLMENGALLLGHADEEIVQAVCEATGEGLTLATITRCRSSGRN